MIFFLIALVFSSILPCLIILAIANIFLGEGKKLPILIVAPISLVLGIVALVSIVMVFNLNLDMGSLSIPVPLSLLTVLSLVVAIPVYRVFIGKLQFAIRYERYLSNRKVRKLSLKGTVIGSLVSVIAMLTFIFFFFTASFYGDLSASAPIFEKLSTSIKMAYQLSTIFVFFVPIGFIVWGLPTHFILHYFGTSNMLGYISSAFLGSYLILGAPMLIAAGVIGAVAFWIFGVRKY